MLEEQSSAVSTALMAQKSSTQWSFCSQDAPWYQRNFVSSCTFFLMLILLIAFFAIEAFCVRFSCVFVLVLFFFCFYFLVSEYFSCFYRLEEAILANEKTYGITFFIIRMLQKKWKKDSRRNILLELLFGNCTLLLLKSRCPDRFLFNTC